jgi:hypothetical protein
MFNTIGSIFVPALIARTTHDHWHRIDSSYAARVVGDGTRFQKTALSLFLSFSATDRFIDRETQLVADEFSGTLHAG